MKLLAIGYYAPPQLTPQSIQVARLLYHLNARVTLLHGRDPQFPDSYHQYPDFFTQVAALPVADPGARFGSLVQRAARRLLPLYETCPDRLARWRRKALGAALEHVAAERPDALVSFGMPMSDHVLALAIRRRTGLPWLAHFSDPWVDNIFHHHGWLARRVNARLEGCVIAGADALLFTSARTRSLVMDKYPAPWRARAGVLPHAWDMRHVGLAAAPPGARQSGGEAGLQPGHEPCRAFGQQPGHQYGDQAGPQAGQESGYQSGQQAGHQAGQQPGHETERDRGRRNVRHVVRHIGACYGTRSPEPLFRALALIAARQPGALDAVAFELVGPLAAAFRESHALKSLPPGLVTVRPPVGYLDALALARDSAALLVIDAPSCGESIFLPSKLIEYIGARRPVWAITPPGTSADLVAEWAGGPHASADPGDTEAVARMLLAGCARLPDAAGPEDVAQRFAAPRVALALEQFVRDAVAHRRVRP